MKVLLYRHLPTVNNINSVFTGVLDVSINSENIGKYQYEIAEAQYMENDITRVYCSPMVRTIETASIIFPNSEIVQDLRLCERNYGDWNGQAKADVREHNPDLFLESGRLNVFVTPPNGESFDSVCFRVANFICDINDKIDTNSIVAVVTHNGIITALKYIIKNDTFQTQVDSLQDFLVPYYLNVNEKNLEKIRRTIQK